MKNIDLIFSKIKTPQELLNFMSENINYGYLGKSGRIFNDNDKDFNEKWFDEYILEGKDDILKTLSGNCWDQVELEREWFIKNNYEVKTIYEMVNLDYKNDYPTHSFLIYKDNDNTWNWFENADVSNKGIHSFYKLEELLNYQYNKYLKLLKEFNITNEEIKKIIITEFQKPRRRINANDYLNHVINSKQIILNINEQR